MTTARVYIEREVAALVAVYVFFEVQLWQDAKGVFFIQNLNALRVDLFTGSKKVDA